VSWVRIDDGFADHPKIKRAGPLAIAAQVRALCYCARYLTNGKIPSRVVAEIFLDLKPLEPRHLVVAKLWKRRRDGYVIHDYLAYNPDRKSVIELRNKRAESGRLGGHAKALALAKQTPDPRSEHFSTPVPYPSPTPTTTPSKGQKTDFSHENSTDNDHEAKKAKARELLKRAGLFPPPSETP
jgi:hypothetical protein